MIIPLGFSLNKTVRLKPRKRLKPNPLAEASGNWQSKSITFRTLPQIYFLKQ